MFWLYLQIENEFIHWQFELLEFPAFTRKSRTVPRTAPSWSTGSSSTTSRSTQTSPSSSPPSWTPRAAAGTGARHPGARWTPSTPPTASSDKTGKEIWMAGTLDVGNGERYFVFVPLAIDLRADSVPFSQGMSVKWCSLRITAALVCLRLRFDKKNRQLDLAWVERIGLNVSKSSECRSKQTSILFINVTSFILKLSYYIISHIYLNENNPSLEPLFRSSHKAGSKSMDSCSPCLTVI